MTAARVFRIPELLEAILLQLDSTEVSDKRDELDDVDYIECKFYSRLRRYRRTDTDARPLPVPQLFALQRVNRDFQVTITGSKDIQRKLTLGGTIDKYYNGRRASDDGIILPAWDSVLDKKILYAYQSALAGRPVRGDTWKTMKINDSDSNTCVTFWFAGEDYETHADTTLGDLLEWEMGVEAQRTAEYGNKDAARPLYKEILDLARSRTA